MYIHGTTKKEQARLALLNRVTNKSFISYLGDCRKLRLCDFGCGLGNLIYDIYKMFRNVEITGLELSSAQYKKAKELNKNNGGVTLINVDLFENKLPDNYFDVTYCRYLLEHLKNPVPAVKEMLRVTKPKGRIISQENDLHNVIYYPPIEGHDRIMRQFRNLQIQMGGDPFIGRKLFDIYKRADAVDIRLSYEPEIYTEDEPEEYKAWMQNSLNILLGVRQELVSRGMIDKEIIDHVCDVMKERSRNPLGISLFHWNRIAAHKA